MVTFSPAIHDNTAAQRYELPVGNQIAFINYRRTDGVVILTHAEVPAGLNGRGIGSALVKASLDMLRSQQQKVIPQCPFIAIYIQRHPEYAELLAR